MTKFCAVCGTDISPFTGSLEQSPSKIEQLQKWDMDIPTPLCASCFSDFLLQAEKKYGPDFIYEEDPPQDFQTHLEQDIQKVQLFTFNPYIEGAYKNLGLVASFVTLGTGPLTTIASTLDDALGNDSKIYDDKLEEAHKTCINKIKTNAHHKGASAVVSMQITFTELTKGHGMLLVCMIGTAITTK
jgi:uncharacterized protein YbjQ (UPF0145 family)